MWKQIKYTGYKIQNIAYRYRYIYHIYLRAQADVRSNKDSMQRQWGCTRLFPEGKGKGKLLASRLAEPSRFAVQLHYLLGPIRKPGDRQCGWGKQAFKALLLHTSKLLPQIPLQKRLCQLWAAAAAWLALLRVVPSWFDCQASQAHALSISSLQSRKLLFLIHWDRVKELQLGKMVFNGAGLTNQAN